MTNVLQWIDEIFLSGHGIKIKQYCTDFSVWVLSSSHNCWTLAELLTPLMGNKSKTCERSYSQGLVNVWDLQHSLRPPSDSPGFSILPATTGAFFSSWKCTFSSRSHIYSFLKKFLLVMGLPSVWRASWVPGSMASWKLTWSPMEWSLSRQTWTVQNWKDPPPSIPPWSFFYLPYRTYQSTTEQLSPAFRKTSTLIKVLCMFKHILSRHEVPEIKSLSYSKHSG